MSTFLGIDGAYECWTRWSLAPEPNPSGIAALDSPARNRKDVAVDIIEAEIRSSMHEVPLEAAKLVLIEAQPIEIARQLREQAQRHPAEVIRIRALGSRCTDRSDHFHSGRRLRPRAAFEQRLDTPPEFTAVTAT